MSSTPCGPPGATCPGAGAVIHASLTDGVHLDADQHITLGDALCETVSDLLRDD